MPVGQRAPTLNMSKILRQVGYRTGQSRKITYYRSPIYGKDDYGVENTTIAVNEIIVPDVQAYIRTLTTKDFVIQQGGGNIVGNALIYLPRLQTLKNFPNMDQDNNIYFNEIEGWDKIIDKDRVVYRIPTSSSTGWLWDDSETDEISSDGEAIIINDGVARNQINLDYSGSVSNILEADRLTFKISASGTRDLALDGARYWASSGNNYMVNNDYRVNYSMLADFKIPPIYKNSEWLTIDMPLYPIADVVSDGTSVYSSGTRYPVTVTSGSLFKNTQKFTQFQFTVSSSVVSNFSIKDIKFYKSIKWSVHSIRDYNDEYMCLECVRTSGKRQSLRRAYAE